MVWRGSDFSYITDLRPELYRPYVDTDIASRIDMSQDYNEVRIAAIKILQEHYDEFIPRWKGSEFVDTHPQCFMLCLSYLVLSTF